MKPFICICCGEPMRSVENSSSEDENVCPLCLAIAGEVSDSSIIDSAIPWENEPSPRKKSVPGPGLEMVGGA